MGFGNVFYYYFVIQKNVWMHFDPREMTRSKGTSSKSIYIGIEMGKYIRKEQNCRYHSLGNNINRMTLQSRVFIIICTMMPDSHQMMGNIFPATSSKEH